jgi:putative transposase
MDNKRRNWIFRCSLAQHQDRTPEWRGDHRQKICQVIQDRVQVQGTLEVRRLFELPQVSRAGCYRDWQQRQPRETEVAIRDAVQKAALEHRQFGYRRVTRIGQRSGIAVGEGVVRRILKSDDLLAVGRRKFKATTNSAHGFTVHTNLAQYLQIKAANQLWVADVTYLRLQREFVYLPWCWRCSHAASAAGHCVAGAGLRVAQAGEPGLVHHSDRGTQYAGNDYVRRWEDAGTVISLSRPARPWENAYCESFMGRLKREQITCKSYAKLEELPKHMEEFIDVY